ncbi:MAG TPA: class I SAM-dependent methyltransferase [Chthoniobacterales bacterium]
MSSNVFSYDAVPYPSRTYLQTHPARLAAMAALMGLKASPVECCRVLEIGTGDGLNIAALAYALPGSEFCGIDLSETAISRGKTWIEELGLTNISLRCADIGTVNPAELGKFDYVIAHGVFSWVPEPVREQMLALTRDVLTENGVAYVSYNAYPGCHIREMSRRMMRYHVQRFESPMDRIAQGRSLLYLLVNAPDKRVEKEKDAYRLMLEEELEHSVEYDQAAFYHDDLSELNTPYYFHEFMAMAEKYGLQFLAEAQVRDMYPDGYAPAVMELLDQMGEKNFLEREQYMDFLKGRRFRQTLLCRAEVVLDREISIDDIRGLRVDAEIKPGIPDGPEESLRFDGPKGSALTASRPSLKRALGYLAEAWPHGVSYEDLAEIVREESDFDEAVFGDFLIRAAKGGIVEFRTVEPKFVAVAGERPQVSAFARWQIGWSNTATTLRHSRIRLDEAPTRELVRLMDGTRTREELAAALGGALENDTTITGENIDAAAAYFCRVGLMVA